MWFTRGRNSPLVSWSQPEWSAGSRRARCGPDCGSSSGAPARRLWSGGSCPTRSPPDGRERRARCPGVWCRRRWSAHSAIDSAGTRSELGVRAGPRGGLLGWTLSKNKNVVITHSQGLANEGSRSKVGWALRLWSDEGGERIKKCQDCRWHQKTV